MARPNDDVLREQDAAWADRIATGEYGGKCYFSKRRAAQFAHLSRCANALEAAWRAMPDDTAPDTLGMVRISTSQFDPLAAALRAMFPAPERSPT